MPPPTHLIFHRQPAGHVVWPRPDPVAAVPPDDAVDLFQASKLLDVQILQGARANGGDRRSQQPPN